MFKISILFIDKDITKWYFFCQSIYMSVLVEEVIFNSKLSFEHDLAIWFTLHLFFGPNSYLVYIYFEIILRDNFES